MFMCIKCVYRLACSQPLPNTMCAWARVHNSIILVRMLFVGYEN